MEITVLTDEANVFEVRVDNVTVAEVLRVYLNDAGADLAVWHRDHPMEDPIIRVEGKGAKKMFIAAIDAVIKDVDSFSDSFKKLK